MAAMRDNETGAAVSGVYPRAQYKILAFATSALVTSVGGGCFGARRRPPSDPDTFKLYRSIEFIAGLVIGGVATIPARAIGGVLVNWLPHLSLEGEFVFSDSTTFSLPVLPTLEGPEATILYGVLLVADHLLHAGRDRLGAAAAAGQVPADRAAAPDAHHVADRPRPRRA